MVAQGAGVLGRGEGEGKKRGQGRWACGRVEEKRAGCRVRPGAKQRGLRRRWSSSHRPSTCYCRRRRRFWASTSRRFSPARLRSPLPALRPQASLPSPSPPHSAPAPPSVCGARDNQQCPRVLTSLLVYRRPPTTRAAQKSSTRKRRAAASSADPSVAIPVMAASVSPGVSSAARKASRLNPSCAATSHSCSAQPHAPEAGVSRALLSAPRTETELLRERPARRARGRSLALPDGATELEVQVGPGNGGRAARLSSGAGS